MILKMAGEYEKELTDFIDQHNRLKEYYIAWMPEEYETLSALDKSNFFICMEHGRIVGCLGANLSFEQKVARMLGPIIRKDYFEQSVDALFAAALLQLPRDMAELKIAFCEENGLCRAWCERNGFELYNAEKTMVYHNTNAKNLAAREDEAHCAIRPYEPTDLKGLEAVHPKGTFFTINELIDGIGEHRRLLLAVSQEVSGYICYELTGDKKHGEILLLHVGEGKRNKGYGTLLLKCAMDELISAQVEQISISVRVDNHRAAGLYKRFGFVEKETVYAYRKQIQI